MLLLHPCRNGIQFLRRTVGVKGLPCVDHVSSVEWNSGISQHLLCLLQTSLWTVLLVTDRLDRDEVLALIKVQVGSLELLLEFVVTYPTLELVALIFNHVLKSPKEDTSRINRTSPDETTSLIREILRKIRSTQ